MSLTPDAYILCATPRSGTTLLCGLLRQTGVAGAPDSFYRTPSRDSWAQCFGLDPKLDPGSLAFQSAFLAGALKEGRNGGPVFGMRLMQENLHDFLAQLRCLFPEHLDDCALISAALGRTEFIYVSRRDPVAQAVSLVLAQHTGLWHKAPDGRDVERLHPYQTPVYDHAEIARTVARFRAYNAAWEAWFEKHQITPLRLVYEDTADNPRAALRRILEKLGKPASLADLASPSVAKLADTTNSAWINRFRADQS